MLSSKDSPASSIPPLGEAPPDEEEVFRNTLVDLLDTPPHMLTGLRFAEDTARQTTGERVMGELFQNARDAMVSSPAPGMRLLVLLEPDALTVANDGARLTRSGFESLTGLCRSPKAHRLAGGGFRPLVQGAIRPMGGQGIGFKCVLFLTDSPQILANTPGGGRLSVELGSPRVKQLCAALARADGDALRGLLTAAEQAVLDRELTPERPLQTRSLPVHLGSRGVGLDELLNQLPVTPFPMWLHPVPDRAAELLGWSGHAPEGGPFDTVVRLPFRPGQRAQSLELIRDEIMAARQAFLGVRVKITVRDEARSG